MYSWECTSIQPKTKFWGSPEPWENSQTPTEAYMWSIQVHDGPQLNTITKALQNHNIAYKWGHPTKLSIDRNRRSFYYNSLEAGLNLLNEWGIIPDPPPTSNSRNAPGPIPPLWHKSNRNFQPKFWRVPHPLKNPATYPPSECSAAAEPNLFELIPLQQNMQLYTSTSSCKSLYLLFLVSVCLHVFLYSSLQLFPRPLCNSYTELMTTKPTDEELTSCLSRAKSR